MTVWELQDKIYTNAAYNIDSLEAEYWGTKDKCIPYIEEKRQLAVDLFALVETVRTEEREKILAPTKEWERSELTKEEYDNLFRGTFSGADSTKEKP